MSKSTHIIQKARSSGASLAGIMSITSLLSSPSHEACGKVELPVGARSVLVLALAHEEGEAELDWWGGEGGTAGNRRLQSIANRLRQWFKEDFNSNAYLLPYHAEEGGVFLKDAAVLSGLGPIGKNNLLITSEFGPRVRFRALLLDLDLEPTGPTDFAPCAGCDMPCIRACPRNAFENGSYSRMLCNVQMKIDIANIVIVKEAGGKDLPSKYIKYCRACELACPVGK